MKTDEVNVSNGRTERQRTFSTLVKILLQFRERSWYKVIQFSSYNLKPNPIGRKIEIRCTFGANINDVSRDGGRGVS